MNEGLVIKAIKNSIYSLSKDLKTTFLTQPSSINEASLQSRRNFGSYSMSVYSPKQELKFTCALQT